MGLWFLIALLAVVVWFNRGLFGFGSKGCDWMGADSIAEDGTRKWMCQRCGKIVETQNGVQPEDCTSPPDLKGN